MAPRNRRFGKSRQIGPSEKALGKRPELAPIPETSSTHVRETGSTISTRTIADTGSQATVPQVCTCTCPGTRREAYLTWLRERYPNFAPQNDYELVSVVESEYDGPESELRATMDKQRILDIMLAQGLNSQEAAAQMDTAQAARVTAQFVRQAKTILDAPAGLTKMKPTPDIPNVLLRPIPNSPYSIRLVPGLLAQGEWCMDFVDTKTGQPVNSPAGFQILSPRNAGEMPWLHCNMAFVRPLGSDHVLLARGAGGDVDTNPDTDTFVVRDGQTCLLRRGQGDRDVLFKVPVRIQVLQLAMAQVDMLDFPERV